MLYAFSLTPWLGKLLYGLKAPDHRYLVYPNNTRQYLELLVRDQPSHILGLGIFTGRDHTRIRIETLATNNFRRKPIDAAGPEKIQLTNFLQLTDRHFQLTTNLGRTWCNSVSYKIMRLIQTGQLHAQYSFLHIPPQLNRSPIIPLINRILQESP